MCDIPIEDKIVHLEDAKNGMTKLLYVLIHRLSEHGCIDRTAFANDLDRILEDELMDITNEADAFVKLRNWLLPKPKSPAYPDWFRGVIDGGGKA